VPTAHPAARIGVDDCHAVAAMSKFGCKNQSRRGFSSAALGIGKSYCWHIRSFNRKASSQIIALQLQPTNMLHVGHLWYLWLTIGK
jgi:hypothetical protein